MANITADNTAAFISYGGEWDDSSEEIRITGTAGSTAYLEFDGTTLSAFGVFNPPNDSFTYLVDGLPPSGSINTIIQPSQSPDQPFLEFRNLAKGHHSITFNLTSGSLGLSHLMWFDPQASTVEGSPIDLFNDSAAVQLDGQWDSFNQSVTNSTSRLQDYQPKPGENNLSFPRDRPGPEGGSFDATLDDLTPVVRHANSSHEHLAVLHRDDGLPNKDHTLTLTKTGGNALRVGQPRIFILSNSTATTPSSPSSTATASTSVTPTLLPSSSGMSKGAVAGTVIGVLVGIGLLAVVLWWFWLRRRLIASNAFEKNMVTYSRVCSKCRNDIAGDCRLECVKPDCPAGIDLHPECKDWNVPEHHDHEVRQVPNK
ncbi:hypothetical protein FRC06_009251 [Ceratobasidium sp. 370]|nr:hypothetical protein FRC06_009251 [Ceratobasidium sp. 370]